MENPLFNKIFRDEKGNIVIAQKPNLPLIVAVTAFVLKQFISNDSLYTIIDIIAFGSFFTWAWIELFKGVNYFRRTLGFLTLLAMIYARFYNDF